MYLNPSKLEDDFIFCGLNMLHETMKSYGVYIIDEDVYRICSELFNGGFNSYYYNQIRSKKESNGNLIYQNFLLVQIQMVKKRILERL